MKKMIILLGLCLTAELWAQESPPSFPATASAPVTLTWPVSAQVEIQGPAQDAQGKAQAGVKILLGKLAFQEIITQALKKKALDVDLFWKNYEAKLAVEEKALIPQWEEEFKKSGESDQAFFLQRKRAIHFVTWGNLKELIPDYKIKSLTHTSEAPSRYVLSLDASVDLEKLKNIHALYCPPKMKGKFEKLFFTPSYVVKEGSWKDLGMENDEALGLLLNPDWRDWLQKNLAGVVTEVEVKNPELFLQMKDVAGLDLKDELKAMENSFWLKLNIVATKVDDQPLMKMRKFILSGEMILYQMKNRKMILSQEFVDLPLLLSYANLQDFPLKTSKALALVPQDHLLQAVAALKNYKDEIRGQKLIIGNLGSFQEIEAIKELMRERLGKMITEVRTVSFSLGKAVIDVSYQGQAQELARELLELARGRLSSGKKIDFPDPHDPFTLELH